ncbi:hypothetical protein B0H14DRAFT_3603199, partial [Mycena olivaceomarginata]
NPEIQEPEEAEQTQTRNAQLLEDFAEKFDELGNLLLDYEADGRSGSPCTCGREGMIAAVQCYDSTNYELSCPTCFVDIHIQNPFHWAEVWDFEHGFFVRHGTSKLGHTIQLGHRGGLCKSPCGLRMFIMVDSNGVHSCWLAFCGCQD